MSKIISAIYINKCVLCEKYLEPNDSNKTKNYILATCPDCKQEYKIFGVSVSNKEI